MNSSKDLADQILSYASVLMGPGQQAVLAESKTETGFCVRLFAQDRDSFTLVSVHSGPDRETAIVRAYDATYVSATKRLRLL